MTRLPSSIRRGLALSALAIAATTTPASAQEGERDGSAPGDVCPDDRIVAIRIDTRPVFISGNDEPGIVRWVYGLGNLLHMETRHAFIASELLFATGDCLDPFLVEESERLLDGYGFLTDVEIETRNGEAGVEVDVRTRDEWSTQVDLGVTYDDGLNVENFRISEQNFLGYGVEATARYRRRLEEHTRSFALSTPRLFGRTNASFDVGESRGRTSFGQQFVYRFVGDATDFSAAESYRRATDFFSYTTGAGTGVSNLLVPIRRERLELAAARRFGEPGQSIILGASFEYDVRRPDGAVEAVRDRNFDTLVNDSSVVPAEIADLRAARGASWLAVHLGTRRYRYMDIVGLDAVREHFNVGVGWFAGVSVGRNLGLFLADDLASPEDWFARVHGEFGFPIGAGFLHGRTTSEIGIGEGGWSGLYTEADLVAYGRASWLPAQTIFFRTSYGAGWRPTVPFQLALGGRDGVRSLRDDQLPGGERLVFTLENRIAVPWPDTDALDLGVTLFADAGRIRAGDALYGVDSDWYGGVGFGLRLGFPSGTKYVWRPDIIFPVGHSGSPVFRVTFELNRLRGGFSTPKLARSRRSTRGAEHF